MNVEQFDRQAAISRKVVANYADDGRTRTSMAKECDINNIMKKYQKTGVFAHVNKYEADYGFCTGEDFQTCMETVTKAETMFRELPSDLRNRFQHNPSQFLDYVQDERNLPEMDELGLLSPKEPNATTESPDPGAVPAEPVAGDPDPGTE